MFVEDTCSTAGEGKPGEELSIAAIGHEGNRCEAVSEVRLPEGNGSELFADGVFEEKLEASGILGLKSYDELALFVPVVKLGGSRKSKSSDTMGRLGYLVACGQVAARDDVERVG